jgi:hypothetical protein
MIKKRLIIIVLWREIKVYSKEPINKIYIKKNGKI